MDYKVLYRKYRPTDFSSIIGQEYMTTILKNAIASQKISHAYIFSGPRGTGKTSTAKVFAKAINCLHPTPNGPCNECENCLNFQNNADIIELDAASNNGVDEIREIINNIKLAPAYSKYKVYIIDEVHMLSTSAFNALLLTLEEPPKHVVFILATTNIEAVPITILSRCQRFDFHKIPVAKIIERLNYVVKEENIAITSESIEEIAYISDGGMRDALSILDQLSSQTNTITIEDVISHFGSVSKKQISDLYDTIIANNPSKFTEMINNFKSLAIDYKLLIRKLLEKIEEEALKSKSAPDYQGLSYESLKDMAFAIADISNYVNLNIDPYLLISITLLNYFPGNNSKNSNSENNVPQSPEYPQKSPINASDIANNSQSKINKKNKNVNNSQNEGKNSDQSSMLPNIAQLKSIRINNCFVNAQKKYLQEVKQSWSNFMDNLSDKTLLNVLIDCNITAASDKVIILTAPAESTINLINENIYNIDLAYNNYNQTSYHFIGLTNEEWQEAKNSYIKNIKNNVKYTYQEEDQSTQTSEETSSQVDSNIENTAFDIFDKNKIEIE